jgi:Cadherin-like beta sandwich domain
MRLRDTKGARRRDVLHSMAGAALVGPACAAAASLMAAALSGCGGKFSPNADLSALSVSAGALQPAFSAQTFDYVVAVPNAVDSVSFTPVAADGGASIRVNGAKLNSGAASSAQSLAVGNNTIELVVKSEDNQVTHTYTVVVVRGVAAGSSDASLSALLVSNVTLSPTFASATTTYIGSVANAVTSVTVTAFSGQSPKSITVNGVAVDDARPSAAVSLAVGDNVITVVVESQDQSTTRTYKLTVTRPSA